MQAVKLTDKVWWVGAIDWDVRNFHGYLTNHGTTYNAYLILGEKITLIDTVKAPFINEMFARISSVIDPSKIDYIISNHSEMDHSGALPETIRRVSPEKIFASSMGVKTLNSHFALEHEITPLKDGEELTLGDTKLTVFETKMLHWPDSMVTYLHNERILFSQDGFGMHLASSERFDDEIDSHLLEHEAAKYYANILLPYSPLITKLIAKLGSLNVFVRMIAPDHGPVWRTNQSEILRLYKMWAEQKPFKKAIVVYDTMWNSTAQMARYIGDAIANKGLSVKIMSLGTNHRSDVATEMLDAGAIVIGSPTLNNNLFPTVADLLTYIKGLRPLNRFGAAFGSYGWSGEAVKQITSHLEEMKIEQVFESINVKYVPRTEDLAKCSVLGEQIADRLLSLK